MKQGSTAHRSDAHRDRRARRYALHARVTRPSPAREEAPEPAVWFPIVALADAHPHGTVRPVHAHPISPAREEAPEPAVWFPISEFEALLDPARLVPEPAEVEPAEVEPAIEVPRPVAAPPRRTRTRRDGQRSRRRRRNGLRLAAVGATLGLLLGLSRVAGGHSGGAPIAQPLDKVDVGDSETVQAATEVVSAPVAALPEPPLPNEEIWDSIANCETGGNWAFYGPTYAGGLGIYVGTWRGFGGSEFASSPAYASRAQQITVAERIRVRHGYRAWGCGKTLGLG